MAHTKASNLRDLQDVLNRIREWPEIRERAPNVFYYKTTPFLHFHDRDGERWADVREGPNWGAAIDVPFGAGDRHKKGFLKEAERRYRAFNKNGSRPSN